MKTFLCRIQIPSALALLVVAACAWAVGMVTTTDSQARLSAELPPPQAGAMHTTTAGAWEKYSGNPVMGGKYETCFDVSVLKEGDNYRMWLSWRPKQSIALVESKDGIHWNEPPQVVLGPRRETTWEDDVNRPVVIKREDGYHMWYTGQSQGHLRIGYATSPNGVVWKRMSEGQCSRRTSLGRKLR